MKKTFLAIVVISLSVYANAQVVNDTVIMNAGYTTQVFYNLGTQTKTPVDFSTWDIGFQTTLMNASIICNDNSVQVYKVPNADSTDFATLDVSGYNTWPQLYNSESTWDLGAFNTGEDLATFNFGWGTYDFNSHEVFGDSLFVVVKGGEPYKFWIRKKTANGDYLIRYQNGLGGNQVDLTIPASSHSSKNFVYLNIYNPTTLDLEPASSDWDILFTHYITYIPYPGIYYPVTGVFSNSGVTVARAYPVDLNTVSYTDYQNALSDSLTEIGYDWKFFDMYYFQYSIVDSNIYFIKGKDNNIYSLRFTGFDDVNGVISFETEVLFNGINDVKSNITMAAVYPNPASNYSTIIYDAKENAQVNADLFDVSGRRVMSTAFNAHTGLNNQTIALPSLSKGIYHLVLSTGNDRIDLKLMVAK